MGRRKEDPEKAALRKVMEPYLKDNWTILIKRDTKLNHILGFLSQNLSLPVNYDISDEISGSTMRVSAGEALVVDQGNYFI